MGSGASGMPLPGSNALKSGKKPINLVAVNDRTWSTDADLEDATEEHSKKVLVYSLPSQIKFAGIVGPKCFKTQGFQGNRCSCSSWKGSLESLR